MKPGRILLAIAAGVILLELAGRAWMAYRRWLWEESGERFDE